MSSADLDDLVAQVMLELCLAWRRMTYHGAGGIADLVAFARKVLRRRVSNTWRRKKRSLIESGSLVDPEAPALGSETGDGVARWDREDSLAFACRVATGRRQRVILDVVVAGGSAEDAAGRLGLPIKEVRRVMRGLESKFRRLSRGGH